jgi:glucose-1-phosphate adenylyltransferase
MSNFVNSGISLVAVLPKEKYLSVMDHLGSGKEWNLDRRRSGLFILPPIHPNELIAGDMKQFHDHLSFLKRANADTVIITPGNHVCKMDYNEVIAFHKDNGADITVVYKDFPDSLVEKPVYHQCQVNEAGNILDIRLYDVPKQGDHICLETYVISKALFIDLIEKCIKNEEYDFLKDAVKANLNELNVKGFHFTGELPFIHSIESFHESNMNFLNPSVIKSFFNEEWSIFTKIKHEPPAKYAQTSSVFRGVKVGKGAVVKDSIIMQKSEIGEGAFVQNLITDKEVKITHDQVVVGEEKPRVIKKAEVI